MVRAGIIMFLAVACFSWLVAGIGAAEAQLVYRIEARLVETPEGERERVISQPTLMTIQRQAAIVQVGELTEVPIDDDESVQVESGMKCKFTPYRLPDGSVKLDLEVEIVEHTKEMGAAIVARKVGVRRIQQIPLGVRIEVPIKPNGKAATHRSEMIVSEVLQPEAENDVPPPPREAKRKPVRSELRQLFNIDELFVPTKKRQKDLRQLLDEWEKLWQLECPDHSEPFRVHSGII